MNNSIPKPSYYVLEKKCVVFFTRSSHLLNCSPCPWRSSYSARSLHCLTGLWFKEQLCYMVIVHKHTLQAAARLRDRETPARPRLGGNLCHTRQKNYPLYYVPICFSKSYSLFCLSKFPGFIAEFPCHAATVSSFSNSWRSYGPMTPITDRLRGSWCLYLTSVSPF